MLLLFVVVVLDVVCFCCCDVVCVLFSVGAVRAVCCLCLLFRSLFRSLFVGVCVACGFLSLRCVSCFLCVVCYGSLYVFANSCCLCVIVVGCW